MTTTRPSEHALGMLIEASESRFGFALQDNATLHSVTMTVDDIGVSILVGLASERDGTVEHDLHAVFINHAEQYTEILVYDMGGNRLHDLNHDGGA